MAAILNGSDLHLSGTVGADLFDECFTYSQVVLALAGFDDRAELTVHLNSPGGYVDDGTSIYNLLRARSGRTVIVIEGMALSSASLIACAGDEVVMNPGTVYMLHEPMVTLLSANAAALRSAAQQQAAFTTTFANVYAMKSGKSEADIRALMTEETWLDPNAAVEAGFADRVGGDVIKLAARATAFDYRIFDHAPERLVALASKKDWRLPDADTRAATSAASRQPKEIPMTDKERADALAAELETLKAQMKSGEDADVTARMKAEIDELRTEKKARENTDAIMALDEAKGHEAQAKALADAGVEAEKAKAILAASPKGTADDDLTPETYGAARMGFGRPGGQQNAKGDKAALAAAVDRTNKRHGARR